MVDTNNPGVLFILSGACVILYGVLGMLLYTNASDLVDQRNTFLMRLGRIVLSLGAVQFLFGSLTLTRDIANNRTMSFKAFLSWSAVITLIMLGHLYLIYAYEMGLSWRFVMSVLSTIPWIMTVGKQYKKHRELINTRERD